MLGFVSKYGSSRGMTTIPSITGLSNAAAIAAIGNKFLKPGTTTTTSTSNSSLDGTVAAQGLTAGSTVDLDTLVNYVIYVYVSPAPYVTGYGSCNSYSGSYVLCDCVGVGQGKTYSYTSYAQTRYWSDGTSDTISCGTPSTSYGSCGNKTECGYVAPTCTPGPGSLVNKHNVGTCGPGTTSIKVCYDQVQADCSIKSNASCTSKACTCTPSTKYNPPTTWYTCKNKQQWRDVIWVNSDCSTGSYSQVRAC